MDRPVLPLSDIFIAPRVLDGLSGFCLSWYPNFARVQEENTGEPFTVLSQAPVPMQRTPEQVGIRDWTSNITLWNMNSQAAHQSQLCIGYSEVPGFLFQILGPNIVGTELSYSRIPSGNSPSGKGSCQSLRQICQFSFCGKLPQTTELPSTVHCQFLILPPQNSLDNRGRSLGGPSWPSQHPEVQTQIKEKKILRTSFSVLPF